VTNVSFNQEQLMVLQFMCIASTLIRVRLMARNKPMSRWILKHQNLA
jgi:hypothetical protein